MLRFNYAQRALPARETRWLGCKWRYLRLNMRYSAAKSSPAAATVPPHVAQPQSAVPPSAHNRSVANWLFVCAAMVGGVVCFGGITRLTESGLSIVEWKPLAGVRPPLTRAEWEAEFAHYQQFPEYKQKEGMTLQEFKFIFFWEWAHRLLARGVGVVFGVPLIYYAARGRFAGNRSFLYGLLGVLGLGGAQGFMGWYMVRSGLDNRLLVERKKATVSAYRLASHLFLAFLIFAAMVRMGYALKLPPASRLFGRAREAQRWARISFVTMFTTAMSGAFVAGLDAGLLYNDGFPFMAGGIFPPKDHLFALHPTWRNFFENHSMVQTFHRVLAGVTFLTIARLNTACSRRRGPVPPALFKTLMTVNTFLLLQVSLGIWTIMSTVYIPAAASHQVGSLLLLTSLIRMCAVVGNRGIMLA